jgi:hypothetical protein
MLHLFVTMLAVVSTYRVSPTAQSQVALFLRPWEYLQPQYTNAPGPDADYVFIAGEPIVISFELWNQSTATVSLNTGNLPPGDLANVVLMRKIGDSWQPVPSRLSPATQPHVNASGRTLPIEWRHAIELPYGSLVVPLKLISDATTTPGTYRLEVKTIPLTCEPDCQVRNRAPLFRFMVRDGSDIAGRAELFTRQAWNAVMTSRPRLTEADVALAELLAVHPRSVWGHQLRGQVAEARKQWDRAAAEYDTALQIVMRNEDQLYAQARPADVQDRIDGLRAMSARAKGKKGRE